MTEPLALSPEAQGLSDAAFPGAMICQGAPHPLLMDLAAAHASMMAATCLQSHRGFQQRFDAIREAGLGTPTEVCAQSWARQKDDPPKALGYEMFSCWRQSPDHWRVVSQIHKYWGGSMSKGHDGVWYACILAVD